MDRPSTGTREVREWLAELLRYAIHEAERSRVRRPRHRCEFVVGYLLGAAQLSEAEQDELFNRCS